MHKMFDLYLSIPAFYYISTGMMASFLHREVSLMVGKFIIGASGSDKQMLCGSSEARVAPTISAVNNIQ